MFTLLSSSRQHRQATVCKQKTLAAAIHLRSIMQDNKFNESSISKNLACSFFN